MISKSITDLSRGISLYHVWVHQAYHEISAKYKRTFLGSIWISGAMVATSLALSIMMGAIQGQDLTETLPYIMSGIMCFALSGYILSDAPEVYMSSANIIKNHAYPFSYYSLESITRVFIVFFHNIVVYYIGLAILQRLVIPDWTILLGLPIVYVNSFVWGTLASMVAARFRDMRFMLPFLSSIMFFLTPVFWRPDNMTGWRKTIVEYNPFYGLLEVVRSPLAGHMAPPIAWLLCAVSLGVGLILWVLFFGSFRSKIAFWV